MTADKKYHYWQRHIDHWRDSGKPQRAYCIDAQVSFSTFSYWRTKLNRQRQGASKWVPVKVTGSAAITVWLPGGIRLDVPAPALADVLPIVYRSLEETR